LNPTGPWDYLQKKPILQDEVIMEKKMRVALAGLFEEVNTFAAETMGLAKITGNMTTGFQKWSGQGLIDGYHATKTYMGGYLDALAEFPEVEVIPSVLYSYCAGPAIERAAYAQMKQEIVDGIVASLPLDAVILQLHGAGVAEGVDDVEGDLCAAIREKLGPDVKMVCSLDHHSNLTDHHLQQMDLMTIVHHYPHIDMYETGNRTAKLVPAMVRGESKPCGHLEHVPLLLSCQSTMAGCLHEPIRAKVEEFAARAGLFEFSFAYGFAFADVPFNNVAVNCWAESPELAVSTAQEFATWVWDNRDKFVCKPRSAADAVKEAVAELEKQGRIGSHEVNRPITFDESLAVLASADQELARNYGFFPDTNAKSPVVIAEKSDNPGAGSPGDATHVLWELIQNQVQQAAVCTIRDPETVQKAMTAGVGKVIDVELGGKASKLSGKPVKGKAYVKSISDGRYTVVSPMGQGSKFDTGPAVGLLIENVDVAVVSGSMQPFDAGQMKLVGFDPRDYRVIVLKSANHFRAWWTPVASLIIDSDPPGIGSNDLWSFKFDNKQQKLYPLDKDAVYKARI
jgi:microcystin degradation protein MlrC